MHTPKQPPLTPPAAPAVDAIDAGLYPPPRGRMSGPPSLDPLADTESAARGYLRLDQERRAPLFPNLDAHECARTRSDYWWRLVEIAAWGIFSSVLIAAWFAWFARPSAAPIAAAIAPPADEHQCRAPARPGESLQILFRHDGDRVVFRCQSLTDWHLLPRPQKGLAQ